MFAGAKNSWIGKSEAKNFFFLCFFDKRSFSEAFEYVWEYGDEMDVHNLMDDEWWKMNDDGILFI